MISIRWNNVDEQIGGLVAKFNELPRYLAKKHLQAVLRRVLKDGVPILKSMTPKGATRRVTTPSGSAKQRGGALRRAVRVRSKYLGRNRDGLTYGVIGYKAGTESRKALWLEFGTKNIEPRRIVQRFRAVYHGPAASRMASEMARGLEKAARELASGKNPGGRANFRRKRSA
jgi:imidazolonepropionase-like amidohydrolase